ncbi:MAG: hypothetical protein GWP39_10370 [Planctomycetia bacterium]|nr:hypothetical protein [Planctomycetia bacterium]
MAEEKDPSADFLIGRDGRRNNSDSLSREIYELSEKQNQLVEESARSGDLPKQQGVLILGGKKNGDDVVALNLRWGPDKCFIVITQPDSHGQDISRYCGVIVTEEFVKNADDLLEWAGNKPVAILRGEDRSGTYGPLWSLVRPLDSDVNHKIIEQLFLGNHPPEKMTDSFPREVGVEDIRLEWQKDEFSELSQAVYEPLEQELDLKEKYVAPAISMNLIQFVEALLNARQTGETSTEAIKRWAESDEAFFGWAELRPKEDSHDVKVGGRDPGEVFRALGDEITRNSPLPSEPGTLGPFMGLPAEDCWLGLLPVDSLSARSVFWGALGLLPNIENLIPATRGDGSPSFEDPTIRFERLLQSRLYASERSCVKPGVIVIEELGDPEETVRKLRGILRKSDWIEYSGQEIWVLLEPPENVVPESLIRRIKEVLPEIRGGGTMGCARGRDNAIECMNRAREILRGGDSLHIQVEEDC